MTSLNPTMHVPPAAAATFESPSLPEVAVRKRAAVALLAAVLLGILGDALLNTRWPGLNVPLWCLATVLTAIAVARAHRGTTSVPAIAFGVAVVFFSSVFAWRETDGVLALSVLSMFSAFGMLAFALARWPADLPGATIPRYFAAAFGLGLSAVVGAPVLVAGDGALAPTSDAPRAGRVLPVLRGIAIAIPILFVFAELLGAADARFADFLARIIDVDLARVIQHVVFGGFIAWVTAGWLRGALIARQPLGVTEAALRGSTFRLGATELVVPLVLLDILFVAFIAFQLPYLFGGAEHLREAAGLTAAEYARRGFFELVAVAALLLPLLLLGNALVRRENAREVRVFRAAASTTLVLLAIIMISAMQRMRLYTMYFGLTESRIFATAAMVWLAVVFALFATTVLRGRPQWFVLGALVTGWVTVATLALLNPAAMIVRNQVSRALDGKEVDVAYLGKLGADAAPAMRDALPSLTPVVRCQLAGVLAARADKRERGLPEDWRWWNASARRAFEIARTIPADLRTCAASAPPPAVNPT